MKTSDKNRAILAEVIARSWKEPEFATALKSNPKETLVASGMDIPEEMSVVVLENSPTVMYAILPSLNDQELFQSRLDQAVKRISQLPENMELRIVRDTDTKSFITIPAAPAAESSGRLSDDELEQVAGGKTAVHTSQTAVESTSVVTKAEVATAAVEAQTVATTSSVAAEVEAVVVPCFIS